MRFVHVADVHLDTGFRSRSSDVRDRLRQAARQAFERCVDATLEEQAHALLIAGDLFDSERVSLPTERFLLEQLTRLEQAGIAVVYATGNHDPGRMFQSGRIQWPENVIVADGPQPTTARITGPSGETTGWVTAAGHETGEVTADLSHEMRPTSDTSLPQVAVLHTQVSSIPAHVHRPYAPSNKEDLRQAGFHYWALGHVHRRQTISNHPPIHYPGNLQGRNPMETGPKGGLLVDLSDPGDPHVEFRAFAPVSWQEIVVDELHDIQRLEQLEERIVDKWQESKANNSVETDSDWVAIVRLNGPAVLWQELREEQQSEFLARSLVKKLGLLDAEVRTGALQPLVSMDEYEYRPDVLGAILQLVKDVVAGNPGRLGLAPDDLAGFDPRTDGALDRYLARLMNGAEQEVLRRMLKENSNYP